MGKETKWDGFCVIYFSNIGKKKLRETHESLTLRNVLPLCCFTCLFYKMKRLQSNFFINKLVAWVSQTTVTLF